MHLEKRKENEKIKYFLAHSYREGRKVHKLRKYLGINLSETKLKERKEIAEKLILEEIHRYKIINDPLDMVLSQAELKKIEVLQKQIPLQIYHLSQKEWQVFSELFTYNTNAIEGSKLNKKEVVDLLENDKWPDKSKEDIAEAFGVSEAIRFIRTTNDTFTLNLIKKIHKIVFKNSKFFAGKFRKKGEEVIVADSTGKIVHEGAPQSRIQPLLKELILWYEQNKEKYNGLILGAVVHNQFENIHPFADGNGRVGRILLNYILLRHNLPPMNIDFKNRGEYYYTLQEYQQNNNIKPTLEIFLKEYKSLQKLLKK